MILGCLTVKHVIPSHLTVPTHNVIKAESRSNTTRVALQCTCELSHKCVTVISTCCVDVVANF